MSVAIKISNVSKQFGNFSAVRDVSLEINAGEIFAFLGVNGAGKTTTIRMVVGILGASSGEIEICGHNVRTHAAEAKRVTGYIPDRPYIYNKLSGFEFLRFVGDLYEVPDKHLSIRIAEVLEEFNLTDWQHELVESYSHGMRQRLATCAALLHDPRVLVVDEPMVGLDPHGARTLKRSLKRYAEQGVGVFLSTHSLNVAEELCDRLAIIEKGSIIAMGTLDEIKHQTGSTSADLENLFLQLTTAE